MTDDPPIEPISPEEEAWLISKCAELDRLAEAVELGALPAARPGWPIVFLDLDDVVALNDVVGGLDALDVLRGKRLDGAYVFAHLWSQQAVTILRGIHVHFGGRLRYVISSSWRRHFTRPQLSQLLHTTGLEFIAWGMEPPERWATPVMLNQTRCHEVLAWLRQHHRGEPFVILDDEYSWGRSAYVAPGVEIPRERLVICEEWTGLQLRHWPRIIRALQTPAPLYTSGVFGAPAE